MKHLLKLADLSTEELYKILDLAVELKDQKRQGVDHKRLSGKTLAMIFTKSSTRTRVSFETGMVQLGGHAIYLSGQDSQIGRGEPVEDTARVLSRYVDGIMIRTFEQTEVEKLAKYATIPVINGLTDYSHPCQVLADLLTCREYLGPLKGKTIAYIGDGNNMANSLIVGATLAGMHVQIATPDEYKPHPDAMRFGGKNVLWSTNPEAAISGAHAVFTDTWVSMGQEEEAKDRLRIFSNFQITKERLKLAQPGAIVQHCLPAYRGKEISQEVFEEHATEIFDEAENRLHVQKAVMVLLMENDR